MNNLNGEKFGCNFVESSEVFEREQRSTLCLSLAGRWFPEFDLVALWKR